MTSGWTIDDLLDHTFDQVSLAAECAMLSRAALIDNTLGPLVAALSGRKWKPSRVAAGKAMARGGRKRTDAERERATLAALMAAGLQVDDG